MSRGVPVKALIVDEPWIGLILAGVKIWEMRKTSCSMRGQIALIRKGSGAVLGVAEVVDALSPIETREEYAAAQPRHRIPPERQGRAFEDGWRTPWVVRNARPLAPIPYRHSSGAVIWVNLEPEIAQAIAVQLGEPADMPSREAPSAVVRPLNGTPRPATPGACDRRTITVTGGNLRNNHLYLPLDFFPADAIGGRNKSEAAPEAVLIQFAPGPLVESDIDGTKRILRSRACREFFGRAGVRQGDTLILTRLAPYEYRIEQQGHSSPRAN